jgi:hypothetical protein
MTRGVLPNSNMGKEPQDKVIRSREVLATVVETAKQRPNHHPPLLCHRLPCSTLLLFEVPPNDPSNEDSDAEMSTGQTDLEPNFTKCTLMVEMEEEMHCMEIQAHEWPNN